MASSPSSEKPFPIEVKELTDLMEVQLKQSEQQELMDKHGKVEGLIKKLKTSPMNGLNSADKKDLQDRVNQFGRNEIPPKPPKSFLYLMWEAVQDTTLVILLFSAAISLILSFFHFEDTNKVTGEEYKQTSNF
jgi:magnesium-transporting ATPase (P-type)